MGTSVVTLLEEVDRYVCDERKVVTYAWLSRKLSLTVDFSKRCGLRQSAGPSVAADLAARLSWSV